VANYVKQLDLCWITFATYSFKYF